MLKKLLVSTVLTATAVVGVGFSAGTASATGQPAGFVPAGVYPSYQACRNAGSDGIDQHRWFGAWCEDLGAAQSGQYLLWVQPTIAS